MLVSIGLPRKPAPAMLWSRSSCANEGHMDWRLKCIAFHVLKYAPRSFYDFLQRNVTRRYFSTLTDDAIDVYSYHARNFAQLGTGRVLEFGAGADLITSLLLSKAGATEILAYDIERIATVEQVNHVIRQLRERGGAWPEITNLEGDLMRLYRIRYCAPGDARRTGLPAGSVDFFCSTSTLEHIPAPDIRAILKECRRIASPRALYSFIVDYHDHYATTDPSITGANFYRYSDAIWRLCNPSNHYQNRLRHSDFERIFAAEDMEPIEARAVISNIAIDERALHPRFRSYPLEDLQAHNGFFCLRARTPSIRDGSPAALSGASNEV
jgi:Methyltransferase domain